jgi:hypothetical protein
MAMADLDLLRFHAESLREYATFWFDPDSRQDSDVSENEAAYHLCEHAAMLFRYTGREDYLKGLTGQPTERRRSLVLAVCRYVGGLILIETARRLLSTDILDGDQLSEFEDLLIERDALEEVLALATRLVADLLRGGDGDLRGELATVRTLVADLDDSLWSRPDVVSVASRALAGLRSQLAVPPDERVQWWFGKAAFLDESFDRETLQELLAATAPAVTLAPLDSVIPFSSSLFGRREKPIRLAAADASSVPPVPSLGALIPELPGVRAVVTRLDPNAYQFVFIDDDTRERSTRLEGHLLVASLDDAGQATSLISGGVTVLRGVGAFDSCRIETAGRQVVATLLPDPVD